MPEGEPSISISEAVTYAVELNPLTGNSTFRYRSTITVKNEGQPREIGFTQRMFGVDASTLRLPSEAQLEEASEKLCLVKWVVQASPGTRVLEVSGKPLSLPLELNASLRINGVKPNYVSAYGVFFINSREGDVAEWNIRLRNTNPVLLEPSTNLSSKPPLFVSVSMSLPEKYFRNIVFNPPANMTSMFEKDSYTWILILREDAEISVEAVVEGFDDWDTIPLTPISISFSPMEESVRESLRFQANSLNMSISMMQMILTPIGNLTSLADMMEKMLGNLSQGLKTMGNQTLLMSDALKTISSELGSATTLLSQATLQFSNILGNISMVDFNQLRQMLNISKQVAMEMLNQTIKTLVDAENDLLEVNNTLTVLRSNLTDPGQKELLDSAIARISSLYTRLKTAENELESAKSQIDPMFKNLESFLDTLEEYRSTIEKMGPDLKKGVSALSQVSSALYEMGSALRLMGEANMMMGENLTSITPMLENATSGLKNVQNSLNKNVTSLRKACDEQSLLLKLMDYTGNRTRLMAPELEGVNNVFFQPIILEEDHVTLERLVLSNNTLVGVRSVKISYNGTFKGVVLNGSKQDYGLSQFGIWVSNSGIVIESFRFYSEGNVLTIWNGQEVKLLFSNGSQISVEVDYSTVNSLGERNEVLEYSIIQPTLGKEVSITVKPGGTTPPLKTSLNMIVILLSTMSLAIAIIIAYTMRRREELIIV